MCGSGTALVEAAVAGLPATGVDLNPIATLVSRAKTATLSEVDTLTLEDVADQLSAAARAVTSNGVGVLGISPEELPAFHNRTKWFADHVTQELAYAKRLVRITCRDGAADLAYCSLSAVLVGVSNQESETRWCAKPNSLGPGETLARLSSRMVENMRRVAIYGNYSPVAASVHTADARALPLGMKTVDLIVTSPPYANSHDYYLYNKLRMFWLGHDVGTVQRAEIGSRNRHSDNGEGMSSYVDAMAAVMRECARVAKPGAVAAFVVADAVIRGALFQMDTIFAKLAAAAGFEPLEDYKFGHRQFNASFQRGFGTRQAKQTHVLVYVRSTNR
jgi:site-specific DNA-methyltransferase (cytosine-N4-specific)